MMKKYIFSLLLLCTSSLLSQTLFAQSSMQWFDPAESSFPVIDGRGWQTNLMDSYDRLPAKAQKTVRKPVWNLSKNTAGEYLDFTTNATTIVVQYTVAGEFALPHMPATGVSGVDLYGKNVDGSWSWAKGSYRFGDTVEYRFNNLALSGAEESFRLYLPLYNTVKWMHIGSPEGTTFRPSRVSKAKPIVLYGTSIMQGACATRPGLAWSNILGRKLNSRIINLGFSGNGQLEKPIIDLMNDIDAKLYVLDCMPNLHDSYKFPRADVQQRIISSVKSLQSAHPGTPILLVEHSGGLPGTDMDTALQHKYKAVSELLAKTFVAMEKDGIKNIFLLTDQAIGFDVESTVDGTHPNDIGMMKYAEAYESIINEILNE